MKNKYSRFAVYYTASAVIFFIVLLIGFSFLVATYLPEEGKESAPRPKYGEANGLREVATKGKSSITPVLATDFALSTDFALRGDWVESATETFAGVVTIGGSTFTRGLSVSAPS